MTGKTAECMEVRWAEDGRAVERVTQKHQHDLRIQDANDHSEDSETSSNTPSAQPAMNSPMAPVGPYKSHVSSVSLQRNNNGTKNGAPDYSDEHMENDAGVGSLVSDVIHIDSPEEDNFETPQKQRRTSKTIEAEEEPQTPQQPRRLSAFKVVDEIAEEVRAASELIHEKADRVEQEKGHISRRAFGTFAYQDVSNISRTGRCVHTILSRSEFDLVIGLVILANGAAIGLESSYKSGVPVTCNSKCVCMDRTDSEIVCQTPPGWLDMLDWCFLAIYTVEISLRFWVSGVCASLRSNWVRFDFFLVLSSMTYKVLDMMALDLESLSLVMLMRILRLARLARAVRLLVIFQTLWKLVQGLFSCLYTLLWTLILVLVLFYMFALLGMELIKVDMDLPFNHPYNVAATENFGDLLDTMLMLLQCFSWDSIASVYRPLIVHRGFSVLLYFVVVLLLMSVALVNLVTALMVETALSMSEDDKEAKKAWQAAKKKKQMEHLKIMFQDLDEDGSGELDMVEINGAPPDIKEQLIDIAGTDDIQSLFDVLDYDGGGSVGTEEFCEGVFRFNTSEKPMELGKLAKQCSEILRNAREISAVLSNDEEKLNEVQERQNLIEAAGKGGNTKDGGSHDAVAGSGSLRNLGTYPFMDEDDDPGDANIEESDAVTEHNGSMADLEARIDGLEELAETMQVSLRQAFVALERLPRSKRALAVPLGRSPNDSKSTPVPSSALLLPGTTSTESEKDLLKRVATLEAQLRTVMGGRGK